MKTTAINRAYKTTVAMAKDYANDVTKNVFRLLTDGVLHNVYVFIAF